MDILLLIIGFILVFVGIIGSFLPILPGPLASWFGLAALYATDQVENRPYVLWISFAIVLTLTLADNFLPAIGTKKFGGSKNGMRGSIAGALIGLFFGPFGILFGPFIGALFGEILNDSRDFNKAFKAALGSFAGFLISTGLKLVVCFVILVYFFQGFWPVKSLFF